MFHNIYRDRIVFVTGHTGFKGSWLCHWLLRLGAKVHGFALDPQPHECLYGQLGLENRLVSDVRADVRDPSALKRALGDANPDIVLHLAAQPLVRLSYELPVETFATNVMGTIHLLDAIRQLEISCACVIVTTDKCYENKEWLHSYREEDPMGGHDPYSASKGCAELVTAAYRNCYFKDAKKVRLATARAGNVIGGGDWAVDRIVPDIFRALKANQPIAVRNKHATRPWQHVLEPLSGYLWLAANLFADKPMTNASNEQLCSAFNFGPQLSSNKTVADLVEAILQHTQGSWIDRSDPNALHEASKLNLAIDKAFHLLDWNPTWSFEQLVQYTVAGYTAAEPADVMASVDATIDAFETANQASKINTSIIS